MHEPLESGRPSGGQRSPDPTTDPAADAGAGEVPAEQGLTAAQVAERVADGRVNHVPRAPSRTGWQIVRANVLTPINLIIAVMLVAIVVASGIGPDMLFAGVIVSNSVIGIVQEAPAARAALDRLAVLTEPHAFVLRDGEQVELHLEQVVADDVLVLSPGAQVVVDAEVLTSTGLELNESLLTGESDPVRKGGGDEVLSGSFVSAGHGTARATRIGAQSYAAELAEEARRFTLVDSELRGGVNRILKALMWVIPPIAAVLLVRLVRTGDGWREALSGVVAASVAMVPDGLVLLTSLAFAAGVVTLARRQALVRELASVELLARVDTLCLDKTGTITTGQIVVAEVLPLGDLDPVAALGALAASDPDPNSTLQAIGDHCPEPPGWELVDTVPFSSTRKWSAAQFGAGAPAGAVAVFLGAPEVLLRGSHAEVAERVAASAAEGNRVVLACTAAALTGDELPPDLVPMALVLLSDEIRPDAAETLEFFARQGIALKVISGDHPGTVAAVARRAGVPGATRGLDARDLPYDDPDALGQLAEDHTVFGRVTPRQKREMMLSLQARGHVVAMTGDGVNDVLALKDADMGIAMGSGSGASRSVAQLVLLDDKFASLPQALAEGRRVLNSVERAANLFIYGTVYSVLISLVVAAAGTEFPFLPRHLTLVRSLSVGIPGFFLALAPDARVARPGFLDRVVRFCLPAGAIAAAATLVVWFSARTMLEDLVQARTATTLTLLSVGLAILVRLTASLPPWRWALVGSMLGVLVLGAALPAARTFFDLSLPTGSVWWVMGAAVAIAHLALRFVPVTADHHVG